MKYYACLIVFALGLSSCQTREDGKKVLRPEYQEIAQEAFIKALAQAFADIAAESTGPEEALVDGDEGTGE